MIRTNRIILATATAIVVLTCTGLAMTAGPSKQGRPSHPAAAATQPAQLPGSAAPARPTGNPSRLTPSAQDAEAASRPDWPYSESEGGTPALVAALEAGFTSGAPGSAPRTGSRIAAPAGAPSAMAQSNADAPMSGGDAQQQAPAPQPRTYDAKAFWHPVPRRPSSHQNTPGGWTPQAASTHGNG